MPNARGMIGLLVSRTFVIDVPGEYQMLPPQTRITRCTSALLRIIDCTREQLALFRQELGFYLCFQQLIL